MGVARFKTWFESSVVSPYIRPIKDDIGSIRKEQIDLRAEHQQDRTQLQQHDKYIMFLLGKIVGTVPAFDIGEPSEMGRKEHIT